MEAQVREWVPGRVSAGTVKHVTKSMRGLPPGLLKDLNQLSDLSWKP